MSDAPKNEDYYKLKGMISELPEEFRQRVSDREAEIRNALALDREATQLAMALIGLEMQGAA